MRYRAAAHPCISTPAADISHEQIAMWKPFSPRGTPFVFRQFIFFIIIAFSYFYFKRMNIMIGPFMSITVFINFFKLNVQLHRPTKKKVPCAGDLTRLVLCILAR